MPTKITAALIGGGASLLGGILGNQSARKEAAKNRAFQERMALNAHQNETVDLKKAGLNRILSISGGGRGAATPSGSTASQSNPALSAASSAAALANMHANTELVRQKTQSERGDPRNFIGEMRNTLGENSALKAAAAAAAAYGGAKMLQNRKYKGKFDEKTGEIKPPRKKFKLRRSIGGGSFKSRMPRFGIGKPFNQF